MSRAITEKEFKEWLEHPVTGAIKAIIEKKRDELRRQWESGAFTDYAKDGTVLVNVANMGTCKGYAFVSELDYEGYITEIEDDGKQVRTGPAGSSGSGKTI